VDGLPYRPDWNDSGEVEKRAGDCRGGDAVADGDVFSREGCPMESDLVAAGAPVAGRDRDVDPRRGGRPNSPQRGCLAVAENRPPAAREHRGHPVPLAAHDPVSHRVDAAVEAMQPPAHQHPFDLLFRKAESPELCVADNPVLSSREGADPPVSRDLCALGSHIDPKAHIAEISAPGRPPKPAQPRR
jgi:hypothetical protein